MTVPVPDMYTDAEAPQAAGPFPGMEQLIGRLLAIMPTSIELKVPSIFQGGAPKDRISADVVFLDGTPIGTIVKRNKPAENLDSPINPGDVMGGMYISQGFVVGQLRPHVGTGMTVFGRLVLDPARQRGGGAVPYVLAPLNAADAATRARYIAYRATMARASSPEAAEVAAEPVVLPPPAPVAAPAIPIAIPIPIATGPLPW